VNTSSQVLGITNGRRLNPCPFQIKQIRYLQGARQTTGMSERERIVKDEKKVNLI